jgi:hypothetical protein
MGLLFTTPGTQAILDTLNTAFDGPGKGLDFIRTNAGPKILAKIGKRNWQPGHLARMLRLLPFDQGGGQVPSDSPAKWWWFLRKRPGLLVTFDPIKIALADAILNQDSSNNNAPLNIVRVTFDHVELAGSANPNVVIFDAPLPGDPNGGMVRHITLFTVAVPPGKQDSQPPLDSDEQDIPVKPPWDKP